MNAFMHQLFSSFSHHNDNGIFTAMMPELWAFQKHNTLALFCSLLLQNYKSSSKLEF